MGVRWGRMLVVGRERWTKQVAAISKRWQIVKHESAEDLKHRTPVPVSKGIPSSPPKTKFC